MHHADDGLLHAYLDGELIEPGENPAVVENHLEECADCRARLGAIEEMRHGARMLLADPLPVLVPPFEAVLARAGRPQPVPRPTPRRLAPLAWAASLVLALGAGWLARDLLRPEPRTQVAMEAPAQRAVAAPTPAPEPVDAPPPALESAPTPRAAAAPPVAATDAARPAPIAAAPATLQAKSAPESAALASRQGYSAATADEVASSGKVAAEQAPVAAGAPPPAWTSIDRAEAQARLQRAPLTVPTLAVLGFEAGSDEGMPAVRVRQSLPDGAVLTLVQRRATAPLPTAARNVRARAATVAPAPAPDGVSLRRADLLVTATGPVPPDSLTKLLDAAR